MSEPFRYCVWCNADCFDDEPEHARDCPQVTSLYPVTEQSLGMRGPDDPYAHGMTCMDCETPFKLGDTYTHRQIEDDVFEVVCLGCSVVNPSEYQLG